MQKKGKDNHLLTGLPVVVGVLGFFWVAFYLFKWEAPSRELQYGELLQILKADVPSLQFQNVKIGNQVIRGDLVTTDHVSKSSGVSEAVTEVRPFRTRIGQGWEGPVLEKFNRYGVGGLAREEDDSASRGVFAVIINMLLILGTIVLGFFLIRWMAGGSSPLTFGRSRHKLYAQKDLKISFADVAGIDEAVAELREIVDFLKTPDKYQALGGRIPKGVLLVGPPGTGKTLLAKAVAGEAEVAFFSMSGSDFVEMFVGVGASRVRDLFSQAESNAPCIIFIDELDALGKTRSHSPVGGGEERDQTLNQLLVEMDGFDSNRGVIIMGATNRPETLDAALLRPGRFDRTVVVDRSDVIGREAILKVHAKNVKLADGVDLRHVASLTPGSVGADLANLVNEAALLAARKNKEAVTMADFDEAIERGQAGLERKSRIMHEDEKRRVAFHEAGHALVAVSLPNTHPVHKVSIIPRGFALGYVLSRPEDDRYLRTRSELESDIKVALGGTLAEEIIFGEISSGATSDLDHANKIARQMVTLFGMSRLGRVNYRDEGGSAFLKGSGFSEGPRYSEETAREIDLETRRIIDEGTEEVRGILKQRKAALEALARRLIEKEVIDGDELRALIHEHLPGLKIVPGSAAIPMSEIGDDEDDEEEQTAHVRDGLGLK